MSLKKDSRLIWVKWAGVPHKVQVGMFLQRRLKSVCASAHVDQSLSFMSEEVLTPSLPIVSIEDSGTSITVGTVKTL